MRFGSKLYVLTQLYTLLVLALFVGDFISQGTKPVPNNHVVVYLALLSAYAADKEVARWAARKTKTEPPAERKGSYVVALWALGYAGLAVWCWLYPEWKMPLGLDRAVIMVIGVFFGSGISKRFCGMLSTEGASWGESSMTRGRGDAATRGNEKETKAAQLEKDREAVFSMIKASPEGMLMSDLVKETGIPRSTLFRMAQDLEGAKRVKASGKKRWRVYKAI
jgi:hypothetical protein